MNYPFRILITNVPGRGQVARVVYQRGLRSVQFGGFEITSCNIPEFADTTLYLRGCLGSKDHLLFPVKPLSLTIDELNEKLKTIYAPRHEDQTI